MIVLKHKGNRVKKEILKSHQLDDDTMKHVDAPIDYEKSFKKHDFQGTLLWESCRTEEDKHFVEARMFLNR